MANFYKDSSDNRYYINKAFTYNNKYYGRALATASQFATLGFTLVNVATKPNERFYTVAGPDINGAWTSSDKNLADLKTQFKRETKRESFLLLRETDWYSIRKHDDGTAIPSDISTYRSGIRSTATSRCNAIDAAATVAALEILITTTVGQLGGLDAFPTLANEANYYLSPY